MIYLNGQHLDLDHKYPDGTYSIRLNKVPDSISLIRWNYAGEHELPAIIYLAKHLREHGCEYMALEMNYIPNARLDRVSGNREVFTLKYFAQIINSLGFDLVQVLDPHSSVSCALIDRLNIRQPKSLIEKAISEIISLEKETPLLFYPDEGAMKRYSAMITAPYAFGIKKRDWESGKITALEIRGESPEGKDVLMIDDICSRGGTFYHSALALKKAGAANIYIFVTHCENTIFEGELLKGDLIRHIYTTDSIFAGEDDKITVLEC